MIVVQPPVTPPYIPSTQAVAYVTIFLQLQPLPDGTSRAAIVVGLLNAQRQAIPYDRTSVPAMTAADAAAFLASPAVAGDTRQQDAERAVLPYLKSAFKITGQVQ